MNKVFTNTAWKEYMYWQSENRQILKRINELIKDIERNGNMGIGKPEPLKHELSGYWSRRINNEHRLIYSIEGNNINIISCLGHY
ncbi:MAG: Txe/YoeB family addiction module toxin [Syntrophomonadaceae bacterium]|nr:Txe/YoeB family addiction module toxin [Syntrophomonadaceae bacterium]